MKRLILLSLIFGASSALADIKVYTDRPSARFEKAVRLFQQQTGQSVVIIEAPYKDLLAKIESDAAAADVVITKDLVYLAELGAKGHLQPLRSNRTLNSVHEFMRDPALHWVGLTFRARSVAYDPSRVNPSELTTYEDLAAGKWQGRLCLRTAKSAYNEALVAHLIENFGEAKAKAIVSGWVANLALPVFSGDVAVIQAIAQGQCDVGIVNHYYLAGEIAKNPNLPVRMAFLDQAGIGVHTNGSGAGVIKGSWSPAAAQAFIEILLSSEVQLEFSAAHMDFPAVSGLKPTTMIKDWGDFKMSSLNWKTIGASADKARTLMTEAGYR